MEGETVSLNSAYCQFVRDELKGGHCARWCYFALGWHHFAGVLALLE